MARAGANYKALSDAAGAAASIGTFGLCVNAVRRLRTSRPGAGRRLVCMPAKVAQLRKALTSYLQRLGFGPGNVHRACQAKGTEAKAQWWWRSAVGVMSSTFV